MSAVRELCPDDPGRIADYQVEGRLGQGRHGVVYLATGPYGETVAIRRLDQRPGADWARPAFADEVAAARLVAPLCTAQILDVDLKGPGAYVVSEYVEGPTLREHIDRFGPMTDTQLQRLALGTMVALAAIHHAGLAHRHLNPANIILSDDGPRMVDYTTPRDVAPPVTGTAPVHQQRFQPIQAQRGDDMLAWASIIIFAAAARPVWTTAPASCAKGPLRQHRTPKALPVGLRKLLSQVLSSDPPLRPTAQQALALLLGRPASAVDLSDPTPVLAEAAWLVRAAYMPPIGEITSRTSCDGR
jgi:serine/threonine protein kinase